MISNATVLLLMLPVMTLLGVGATAYIAIHYIIRPGENRDEGQ